MADVPSIFGPVEDPSSQGVGGLLFDPQNYEGGASGVMTIPNPLGAGTITIPRYGRKGTNFYRNQQDANATVEADPEPTPTLFSNLFNFDFADLLERHPDGVIDTGSGKSVIIANLPGYDAYIAVSYTHLRAHETSLHLV